MKKLFFLLFIICQFSCFSQDYIGKDFNVGKADLKKDFANKGFNFIKEKSKTYNSGAFVSSVDLLYKEEFVVIINKNKFDNIASFQIYTNHEKIMEKIKNVFSFSSWKYEQTIEDGIAKVYTFKDVTIKLTKSPDSSIMKYTLFFYKN
ncbi:hypothetical protein [Flavobacterium psychrotrophum]|uniref:hypothetical protein n=1 Tax=Flavobacterium psychrotrophum TaxID=2294119 RepID=UPI000E30D562|nr:hypothetical protein [Flavobacterium psychrotrophum]